MGLPALAALAIGPSLLLIHYVWSRDRYREPPGNLVVYFVLGALSVVPAALLESALHVPILGGIAEGVEALPTAVWAFLGVALVEEAFKYGALWLRVRKDPHLDEPFDWLVYAVAISLGFAALENVFYVLEGGAAVAIARALTAVPSHALDGTMMGWHLARAHGRTGAEATRHRVLALLEPVAWHGAYDYLLMLSAEAGEDRAPVLRFGWLVLVIAQWVVCVGRLRTMCREQHVPTPPILMPAEVAGRLWRR
ncbi:MAG: PrsW family glutamic-type intramembrane protease [Planctomycetota bacterium]|nr:PrsW family glutamic-type intramembrane protease [Planctomycetota bacterium]